MHFNKLTTQNTKVNFHVQLRLPTLKELQRTKKLIKYINLARKQQIALLGIKPGSEIHGIRSWKTCSLIL
jgi:hypothetical protein